MGAEAGIGCGWGRERAFAGDSGESEGRPAAEDRVERERGYDLKLRWARCESTVQGLGKGGRDWRSW